MSLDWLSAFLVFGLFYVVMVIGLALLLHLQLGLAGLANFGIVGFWGIGMYGFGVAFVRIDWPFGPIPALIVSMLIGAVVAALAGLVVGWLISDLDIDGTLVGTLGFATIVWILVTTQVSLTEGARGMGGLNLPYDIGTQKDNETLWLGILLVIVIAVLYYVGRVHRVPYGRLLIAVGGNEPLGRSLGKSTYRTKMSLFVVGSAGMGLLGAMYGMMVHFLTPNFVSIEITLAAMVGLVLGGSARVWGAVIGVLLTAGLFDIVIQVYAPLPDDLFLQAIPVLREMMFGLTLILVLMFRPLGILGEMRRDKLMRDLHGEELEPAGAVEVVGSE